MHFDGETAVQLADELAKLYRKKEEVDQCLVKVELASPGDEQAAAARELCLHHKAFHSVGLLLSLAEEERQRELRALVPEREAHDFIAEIVRRIAVNPPVWGAFHRFLRVSFPPPPSPAATESSRQMADEERVFGGRERDDFLARVERVARLRNRGARIERVRIVDAEDHLRVALEEGDIVRVYPIAAAERLTQEWLDRFREKVELRYRKEDPGLISYVICAGPEPPPKDLVRSAAGQRIRVVHFGEYQSLIDFRSYVAQQTARLAADPIYPPSLYVRQRLRYRIGEQEATADDALALMEESFRDERGRFILVLGDFGTGKTFLLHELARRMGERFVERSDAVVPIFVEVRALEKARTLDALVAQHLALAGMDRIDIGAFRYLLSEGRLALLFDGFDELALRVSYARAADHFDTLLEAASGRAKVVVTSRRQHFASDAQVTGVLASRLHRVARHRVLQLEPFSPEQVEEFLEHRLGSKEKAQARLALIRQVNDLGGLAANPRMLGLIVGLEEDKLRAVGSQGPVTAAQLYGQLIDQWFDHEIGRREVKGGAPGLNKEDLWRAVIAVAVRLWHRTERTVHVDELPVEVKGALQDLSMRPLDVEVAVHDIGSGSLLVRDEEGSCSFLHQSVLEYLVAAGAAREMAEGRAAVLGGGELSPLMADFLAGLLGRERAVAWARRALSEEGGEALRKNALFVLGRLGEEARTRLVFVRQDLRGQDLSGRDLSGADFTEADLTEARLVGTNLRGATLRGVRLDRADLTRAQLGRADLRGAEASFARFVEADLRGARLEGARLRGANLVAAMIEREGLSSCDTLWASAPGQPERAAVVPQVASASACYAVAWSSDGLLIASGHANGTVWLWEAATGRLLHVFRGHSGKVRSVAFSHDGKTLASGAQDQAVWLWETGTGTPLHIFQDHTDNVQDVAFSPDGQILASGANDETVRLWDVASGRPLHVLQGHHSVVVNVAFSPDGKTLASGSDDNTVRLWETATGTPLRVLAGHKQAVWSVAFSPDGKTLASGCGDNTIRLWETDTGTLLRVLRGHDAGVESVAFSPDGKLLASAGGYDGLVRLWDIASGTFLRVLDGGHIGVCSVAFSPDGRILASDGMDGTVWLWDPITGQPLRVLQGRESRLWSAAFSADGKTLFCTAGEKTMLSWDVVTGTVKPWVGLPNNAEVRRSTTFTSPDGKTDATLTFEGTLRLRRISDGQRLATLFANDDGWVVFTPDGRYKYEGDIDGAFWHAIGLSRFEPGELDPYIPGLRLP